MRVNGLDHINIRSRDVPASTRFYVELLGLEARPSGVSTSRPIEQACWLVDQQGQAIVHLFEGDNAPGSTGAIHHIALRCSGKSAMIERLQQLGLSFDMREIPNTMTQIFLRDPHGILLELNFAGE